MRFETRAVPHWAVFGLGMSAGAALLGLTFVHVYQAFAAERVGRGLLIESLLLMLAALALFLAAGWGFANRPRPAPPPLFEGFTYS